MASRFLHIILAATVLFLQTGVPLFAHHCKHQEEVKSIQLSDNSDAKDTKKMCGEACKTDANCCTTSVTVEKEDVEASTTSIQKLLLKKALQTNVKSTFAFERSVLVWEAVTNLGFEKQNKPPPLLYLRSSEFLCTYRC